MGHILTSHGVSSLDLVGCVTSLIYLEPRRLSPQDLTLLGGVRFITWHLRHPLFRRMPTQPKAFLEPLGMTGLWPCTRSHLKKGLVPHLSRWWDGQKIPLERWEGSRHSQGYLCKSEWNSATGVQTHLLQCHSPLH